MNSNANNQKLQFDELAYLDANPDVAAAVFKGNVRSGYDHWLAYGKKEKRALNKSETRIGKVFSAIDKTGFGLEIGPSHNPLAPKKDGYNVHILDHADAETLKNKYKGHGVNLENIEEVDFVWQGQPLTELIGNSSCYDWIIASHVIEHVPDLVSFLKETQSLLKPGGVLSLVIPDKRYCFDHFSPISSTGEILDANQLKRDRPSVGKIFDHFANACNADGQIAWGKGNSAELKMVHDLEQAKQAWLNAQESPDYVDVHCWRFVPSSFEMIIKDLNKLGLINLTYRVAFDTKGCEFFVTLEKNSSSNKTTFVNHLDFQNRIKNELADA